MVSLSIKPFLNGLQFRRGNNRKEGLTEPGECAGSECTTLCNDMIKMNHSRILSIPRVKVAYDWNEYKLLKSDPSFIERFPINAPYKAAENISIEWRNLHESFYCMSYLDGNRGRSPMNGYQEFFPKHKSPASLFTVEDI